MRRILLLGFALVFCLAAQSTGQSPDPTDLDLDGLPGVAGPPASPESDAPSVLVGTGRLLIDRAHGGAFDVSGFTNFLAGQGWVVSEHWSGPVTSEVLSGVDILLVPTRTSFGPTNPYTQAEVVSIQAFLQSGEGLWMPHDNKDPAGFNSLSQTFGVTYYFDYIQDPTNNEGELFWPTIYLLDPHPITAGVGSYGLYLGDCLTATAPARVIGRADDDAYSLYCPTASRPAALAVWEGNGRAVFASDITPLHPSYYPSRLRPEEELLLQNITNWLLGPPPTSTSSRTWGRVKSIYATELPREGPRSVH